MIVVQATFQATAANASAFRKLAQETAKASAPEKGCVAYHFTADLDDPNRLVLTEIWQSEDDLKAHFGQEAFKRFMTEMPKLASIAGHLSYQGPLTPYNPMA
jgi:quinol monooxygenase YgiN